jgi:hypothetical protein
MLITNWVCFVKQATATTRAASRQAIIDELGEVDRQFKLWTPGVNPHAARRAELHAIVCGWYGDAPPAESYVVEGRRYRLQIKACQFRREVTAAAQETAFEAVKKTGLAPFSIFRATQESIQKLLGEAFLDRIAPKKRTGPRTFELVPLAGPQLVRNKA